MLNRLCSKTFKWEESCAHGSVLGRRNRRALRSSALPRFFSSLCHKIIVIESHSGKCAQERPAAWFRYRSVKGLILPAATPPVSLQDATLRQQQPPCSPALEGEELRSQCKTWKKTLFYFSIFLDSVEIFLFPCKVTHHLYSVAFHEPGGGSCIKLRLGKSCLSGCSFGRGLMIIWRCLVSSLVVSLLYLLPYLKLNGQVWYLPDFKMRAVKLFFRITWFYALLIWTGVKPSQFSVAGYCVLPRQSKKINKWKAFW